MVGEWNQKKERILLFFDNKTYEESIQWCATAVRWAASGGVREVVMRVTVAVGEGRTTMEASSSRKIEKGKQGTKQNRGNNNSSRRRRSEEKGGREKGNF